MEAWCCWGGGMLLGPMFGLPSPAGLPGAVCGVRRAVFTGPPVIAGGGCESSTEWRHLWATEGVWWRHLRWSLVIRSRPLGMLGGGSCGGLATLSAAHRRAAPVCRGYFVCRS